MSSITQPISAASIDQQPRLAPKIIAYMIAYGFPLTVMVNVVGAVARIASLDPINGAVFGATACLSAYVGDWIIYKAGLDFTDPAVRTSKYALAIIFAIASTALLMSTLGAPLSVMNILAFSLTSSGLFAVGQYLADNLK